MKLSTTQVLTSLTALALLTGCLESKADEMKNKEVGESSRDATVLAVSGDIKEQLNPKEINIPDLNSSKKVPEQTEQEQMAAFDELMKQMNAEYAAKLAVVEKSLEETREKRIRLDSKFDAMVNGE